MKKKSELAFDSYINNYDKRIKSIRYKYYHSYQVEKLMKKLAIRLGLSKEDIKIAELIGLLHDIGRFEQIKKFGIVSDVKTGVDHADESCIYLFDKGHIRDFIDTNKYDGIIKDAIKNHNKYEIDKNVTGKNLLFAKMIRDMDKVDIYRVLSVEYKTSFNKDEISKNVYESYMKHQSVDSHDRKTETDVIFAHTAFIYDMNFEESFKILKETNYLNDYLNTVIVKNNSENEFEKMKKEIDDFINNK